jgi:hypothetical protein
MILFSKRKPRTKTIGLFMVIVGVFLLPEFIMAQSCYIKKQSVNMKIEKDLLLVSGMYYVTGTAAEPSTVIFPLPNGTYYGAVDSLHVYDVSNSDSINATLLDEETILFSLNFDNTSEYLIQVFYRIKLLGSIAEYPFSRNAGGTEKIETACFYLNAPVKMNVRKFNYIPKDTIDAGANVDYYWEMHDFVPKENFEFRFR